MKKSIFILAFLATASVSAQTQTAATQKASTPQIVEASCGQCNFGMTGGGCTLAVRIDGKPYFVDGAKIDQYGEAHDADGFCSVIRKAEVTGEIVGDKFKATSFKLLPVTARAKK
jgi:hypothetical protein